MRRHAVLALFAAVLVGSAYARHFYDSPAALSQKYGIEIDASLVEVSRDLARRHGSQAQFAAGDDNAESAEGVDPYRWDWAIRRHDSDLKAV